MSMGRCKSCAAPVRWVKTSAGRNMPLDDYQVEGGSISLERNHELDWVAVVHPLADVDPQELGYRSHFASCPESDSHRKKRP